MASSVLFNLPSSLPPAPATTTTSPSRTRGLADFQINSHLITPLSRFPESRNLFTVRTATSSPSSVSTIKDPNPLEPELGPFGRDENFDWYSHWYPIMPVCDLDKRVPHAKKVIGIDVVVWWDRNEDAWKVFDDTCPHRLAPLSNGRIDQWGRLQCVYHGWCFDGKGDCKFIPQAPPDGPPVHTFKKACAAAYPCTVQNGILWFWPNSDPQFKDILSVNKPPYIPELDDPSFTHTMGNRDMPFGYEVLIENFMDPAHAPYVHYGIMQFPNGKSQKRDREGGVPMDMAIETLNASGYTSRQEREWGKFIAPCFFCLYPNPSVSDEVLGGKSGTKPAEEVPKSPESKFQRKFLQIFMCIPVSPGKSRLIWTFARNVAVWTDKVVPRWMFHVRENLILDSALYLIHVEEHKLMEIGPKNWQKAFFLPTKADALVVGFRRWLDKYAGGGVDWRNRFSDSLPPTPPREQLMDRYWTHVVNCGSCSKALKYLKALEVALPVLSVAMLGVFAAVKHNTRSAVARMWMVGMAVLLFAASRWLSRFIYKNFYYHDYNHALR